VFKYRVVQFDYEVEAGSEETAKELVYWGIAEETQVKDLDFSERIRVKSVVKRSEEAN
jgi:ribosomal protein L20A (L18A)